jgi:AcrR family transcriptional regulator
MAESVALKGMPLEKKVSYMLYKTYEGLVEVGYNKITLDMVAEKVGVSKGTISYYFNNKEELMAKTFEYLSGVVYAEVNQSASEESDPKQRLLNLVDGFWNSYWKNPKYPDIMKVYFDLWFHGMHNKSLYDAVCVTDGRLYDIIYKVVSGIYDAKNEQSNEDLFTKVIVIASTIDGAAKIVLSGTKDIDQDKIVRELKATVLKIVD